jgi:hypothetical protein
MLAKLPENGVRVNLGGKEQLGYAPGDPLASIVWSALLIAWW